jgi:ribosome-associated protein
MGIGELSRRMNPTIAAHEQLRIAPQTRILVQAAAAACEDKKGQDTRILELDPVDSGLSDFFLVTSATNDRQAVAIADEIELRLKREFGAYAHSVEGRRQGEWILLDYVDFVVHVFLAERRAFYDIERLRKSARPLTPAEFDAELKSELKEKTRSARTKIPIKRPIAPAKSAAKPATKTKMPAKRAATAKKAAPPRKVAAAKEKPARPAAKKTRRSR